MNWFDWFFILALVSLLAASCTKQNTLKCYSGEIGRYEQVPCPVPANQ
jgi:hypothetical protein